MFSCSVTIIGTLSDPEDLVVARGTVVVTILTSTSNSPLDMVRMPSTNTSNLTQTLMSLTRQLSRTPTASNTLRSVTLSNGNDVYHLILLENGIDVDRLLEQVTGEVNLVRDRSSIDLDLHQMCLLLLDGSLADLCVSENTDNSAVFLDTLEFTCDRGSAVLRVLLGVVGEGLLLASVPVLVEPSLDLITKMLGPHGSERPETTGSFNVTDNTNGNKLKNQSIIYTPFFFFFFFLLHLPEASR